MEGIPASSETEGSDRYQSNFKKSDVLVDGKTSYTVQKQLGAGTYGKVLQCLENSSKEIVAIKYMKLCNEVLNELKVSKLLKKQHLHEKNIIQLHDIFIYKSNLCLVFEMLDASIQDVMRKYKRPFRLSDIRIVTQQMLVALDAIHSTGLVHADIKPDNIMFVDHQKHPCRVKLIDFGLSGHASDPRFQPLQAYGYRAPEVLLGLPVDGGVDVWSLGATLGYMLTGKHIFPPENEYDLMQSMVHMLGQPGSNVLDNAKNAHRFFSPTDIPNDHLWRMKTPEEYAQFTSSNPTRTEVCLNTFDRLQEKNNVNNSAAEEQDMKVFLDLLRRMLHIDPAERITASQALQHPFITLEHLHTYRTDPYSLQELEKIKSCLPDHQSLCWTPEDDNPVKEQSSPGIHSPGFADYDPNTGENFSVGEFDKMRGNTKLDLYKKFMKTLKRGLVNMYREYMNVAHSSRRIVLSWMQPTSVKEQAPTSTFADKKPEDTISILMSDEECLGHEQFSAAKMMHNTDNIRKRKLTDMPEHLAQYGTGDVKTRSRKRTKYMWQE